MKNKIQTKLASSLYGKSDLNKKALQIRKSWDEVNSLLKGTKKTKKKS